jgi:VIT1/CCC1 family predicted Fe2+/Mn2+ transporter
VCIVVTLAALILLGAVGARLGGAERVRPANRVLAWGATAMAVTSGIGALVGAAV